MLVGVRRSVLDTQMEDSTEKRAINSGFSPHLMDMGVVDDINHLAELGKLFVRED